MKIVEKLQKRLQEGKKNNKGFSLVELIIVIAIMAILIGIVGMNVIPQIENARKAKDAQLLSAYLTEAMEAYTQNVSKLDVTATYKIIIKTSDGSINVTGGSDAENKIVAAAFAELSGLTVSGGGSGKKVNLESKAGSEVKVIKIECKNDAPMITLTACTDDNGNTAHTAFEVYTSNEN